MKKFFVSAALGALLVTATACNSGADTNKAQTSEAKDLAGKETIASALPKDSKYAAAAKAAGIDQTLAGPGPYTVLVVDDAGFNGLSDGTYDGWMKPENRAKLVGAMTNMILAGTVLAEDIGTAVDNGGGKAELTTLGGGTVTATKDGDTIVLTDANGQAARIVKADDMYSNGVVHHLDHMLTPKG